ncbi:MAG TPA: tetratricopeptide repeat protein [Thermodesulfobacteriota bacterium]|nr:tetratricopeptide repeat protein [Thermodesulfobacteriota bacterium]
MGESERQEGREDGAVPDSRILASMAESLRLEGNHDEAIRILTEGLKRAPDALRARLLLGKCYLEKGMAAEARGELEAVARVVEECLPVYKLLSQVYVQDKDVDRALDVLRKFLYFESAEEAIRRKASPLEFGMLKGPRPPFATPPPLQQGMEARPAPERQASPPPEPQKASEAKAPLTKAPEKAEEEETAAKPPLQTDTLAEIYMKQGHLDRALSVFEDILRRDPGNTPVREKAEALKEKIAQKKRESENRDKVRGKLEKWVAALPSKDAGPARS